MTNTTADDRKKKNRKKHLQFAYENAPNSISKANNGILFFDHLLGSPLGRWFEEKP